jgi:hypothetical protein
MVVRGEKLGGDPRLSQPTCYGSGRELFFSRAVNLSNKHHSYREAGHELVLEFKIGC